MRRRDVLKGLGCIPLFDPVVSHSREIPNIGFLSGATSKTYTSFVQAFRAGLVQAGLTEGKGFKLIFRWAEGQAYRLPSLASELVAMKVSVIAATGGNLAGLAAKAATTTIPIVFMSGRNPVDVGFVRNLNRPEGNLTGINLITNELDQKRLEIMLELFPSTARIGVLHMKSGSQESTLEAVESAAQKFGLPLTLFEAKSSDSFDEVFKQISTSKVDWILVHYAPPITSRRASVVRHLNALGLPAIYGGREYVLDGGLVSYGSDLAHAYMLVGQYAARLMKGHRVQDLPVTQAMKFELVINARTARSLGVKISGVLESLADEIIE